MKRGIENRLYCSTLNKYSPIFFSSSSSQAYKGKGNYRTDYYDLYGPNVPIHETQHTLCTLLIFQ